MIATMWQWVTQQMARQTPADDQDTAVSGEVCVGSNLMVLLILAAIGADLWLAGHHG